MCVCLFVRAVYRHCLDLCFFCFFFYGFCFLWQLLPNWQGGQQGGPARMRRANTGRGGTGGEGSSGGRTQARKDQVGWGARARKDRVRENSTSALCTKFTLVLLYGWWCLISYLDILKKLLKNYSLSNFPISVLVFLCYCYSYFHLSQPL